MTEQPDTRRAEFLIELEKLTRRFKLQLGGCGCCGSPWLMDIEEKELSPEYHYTIDGDSKIEWVGPS